VVRGVAGSGARQWGRCGAEEAGTRCRAGRGWVTRGWDAWGQESWGRSGSVRSDGWPGRGGCAHRVVRLGTRGSVGWLVGPLDPGDESPVHHPR
jgi:hypothetical protein